MMKDFFKKISKQNEPEDLDTGYDSDYYGGAYGARETSRPEPRREAETDRYDERYERDSYARGYVEEDARGYREPAYREEREPEPEVVAPVNAGTLYYTPETYRDCREAIVSGLAESHVVVVNMKNLDAAATVRLFDYIMGAVQVLEADMTRLNATALLLAPKDLEVTEDDLRSLFAARTTTPVDEIEEDEDEAYDEAYDDLSDDDLSDDEDYGI